MKKILISIISLAFIATTTFAQTEQEAKDLVKKLKKASIAKKNIFRSASTGTISIEQMDSVSMYMNFMGFGSTNIIILTNDANGRPQVDTTYTIDDMGGGRYLSGASQYTYDVSNRTTSTVTREYDGMSWVYYDKTEYIYVGSTVNENYYLWSGSTWVVQPTESYVYDLTSTWGNCILPILEIKHYNTGEWEKYEAILDGNNRVTDEIYYSSLDGVTWTPTEKTTYVFNINGYSADVDMYEWTGSAWGPSSVALMFGIVGTQYYSMINIAASINNQLANKVSTYPNPTVDGFYVNAGNETVTVSLYGLGGEMILSKEVSGVEYISVNGLAKGTYIVNLSQGASVTTKKLIVK